MNEKKSEQNKMARRCFLSNCAKLAAGAAFVGFNTNTFGKPSDTWEDYEYCCYTCPSPCSYDSTCPGCREATTVGAALGCSVRICVMDKGLNSCAFCEDLATCNKNLWINYPNLRATALQKQAEWMPSGTSQASLKFDDFRSYPNVTNNGITIINRDQLEVECRVLDALGKTVKKEGFSSDNYYLDLSDLPAGTYILNVVKDNELVHLNKIVKN